MALDVGELVARLTLDDDRFTRGIQNAQQQSQRFNQQLGTMGTAAQQASRQLGQIELNRRLDQQAQQAAQRVQELAQNAQRAGRSTEQIELDDRLLRDARNAANQIEELRRSAQQAGDQVGQLSDDLGDVAGGAGGAGEEAGGNFLSGFSDAIGGLASKTGPIAGSILGVAALGLTAGALLAAAIKDGMEQELSRDLFQAQTGVTEAQARKFALAAGEAFADAFGESVEGNLSTLKLALQNNLIDPGATQRDAESVVANLETISTALDGEVTTSVNAVSALMSTGLATSAQEASDMIANAVGGSANKGEDLLEVIWEYSAGWKNAGISAEAALAMIEQATDNGAWNADAPGDALREFGRRITEEGETIVETLNGIGLNGEEMYKAFQRGGDDGFEALDKFFDKIRGMEDPVKRNAAIMGLLGDTSGDFVDVFAQWDPSEALKNFGEFEGAAGELAGVLGGNAATSVQGAMNSIQVAVDGLKGVLAEAFGPYIAEFADSISNNRAGVIQFFLDVADAAFTGGEAVLTFVANGLDGFADLAEAGTDMTVSLLRSLADMTDGLDFASGLLSSVVSILSPTAGAMLEGVLGDAGNLSDKLNGLADTAEGTGESVASGARSAADGIRNNLLPGLEQARGKVAEFGGQLRDSAAYNDEIAKVSKAIGDVGVAADGSKLDLEGWLGVIDTRKIPELDASVKSLVDQLGNQVRVGLEAGVTVEELTNQYGTNRVALIDQLMALGMTNDMAVQYANSLGLTPELVQTQVSQPGMPEAHYALDILKGKVMDVPDDKTIHTFALTKDAMDSLRALGLKVETLPDGTVRVTANTAEGETIIRDFLARNDGKSMTVYVDPVVRAQRYQDNLKADIANGGTVHYAEGGIEDHQAQIGDGRTRIWNEPETGGESYIPLAPSKRARSEKILEETARRFGLGVVRFANGGIFNGDAAIAKAQAHNGEPYVFGGRDCSGYLSEVFNAGTGQSVRFVTGSDFEAMGWEPGYDPDGFSIGTDKGVGENGHMAGRLFGVNIESDGSNGVQYGGSADGPLGFPYVYHWPGASRPGYDPAQLDSAISQALADETGASTPEAKAKATQRRQALEAQRDGVSGTTDSGVGLATDGQRVFITNWPSGLSASIPAPSSGGSTGGGTSYPSGGGALSTARKAAGDTTEESTLKPRPISEYINPDELFWQFAEGMGISKPGGLLGALMDPKNQETLGQAAAGVGQGIEQWRPGVQIDNHITVADQDQLRRYEELIKRLLAQFGGAMP
ncbi:phage tail tape measure protein [Promicromonospora sukumoe]